MMGPIGIRVGPNTEDVPISMVRHFQWGIKAKNGARLYYQAPGAESYENAPDRILKHVPEATITLTTPAIGANGKEIGKFDEIPTTQDSRKFLATTEFGDEFEAHGYTYKLADVLSHEKMAEKLFSHFGIYDEVKKLIAAPAGPKQPKRIAEENGKLQFIAYDYGTEHELQVGTKWANDAKRSKRVLGQIRQRLFELVEGMGQSLRDPLDTGKTGGRVLFTSVLVNVFVLAIVALVGLALLHRNDQAAQKMLEAGQ